MLIALAKKEENIVEYILYMFQLHDLIRGLNFDQDAVLYNLVKPMAKSEEQEAEILKWYADLMKEMKADGVAEKGFTHEVSSKVGELSLLHGMLMQQLNDERYAKIFETALPFIQEFRTKTDDDKVSDILICFNAMYAKLILKLKKTNITNESEEAFQSFSTVLAYLAMKYKEMYQGKLTFSLN
jgi:hypothetical protein